MHYVYGNIHLLQKNWDLAWRSFDKCLKIGLADRPLHPITAAAYYSLGCVKFEQGELEPAKYRNFDQPERTCLLTKYRAWLEKARSIAQLNSPMEDDGSIARILWKISQILEADPEHEYREQANELKNRAELARNRLLAAGKGGSMAFLRDRDDAEEEVEDEEDDYDVLVSLFYR